jgi:hypothetical protein
MIVPESGRRMTNGDGRDGYNTCQDHASKPKLSKAAPPYSFGADLIAVFLQPLGHDQSRGLSPDRLRMATFG